MCICVWYVASIIVSKAVRERLCFVCLQYRCVLSEVVGLSLYEKPINWLFSHRERSALHLLHPCGISLSLCVSDFSSPAPSLSLAGIGAKPFLSSLITETKWEGKRDERVWWSCGHSWGFSVQTNTPGGAKKRMQEEGSEEEEEQWSYAKQYK